MTSTGLGRHASPILEWDEVEMEDEDSSTGAPADESGPPVLQAAAVQVEPATAPKVASPWQAVRKIFGR